MNKQNLDKLADEAEKRFIIKEKRKRQRMKVSGARIKELQRIILSSSEK